MKKEIPVLIENWIDKMNDSQTPIFQRQNFRGSLMDMKEEIEKAIRQFDREKKSFEKKKYGS